jgi:hypothetical protein
MSDARDATADLVAGLRELTKLLLFPGQRAIVQNAADVLESHRGRVEVLEEALRAIRLKINALQDGGGGDWLSDMEAIDDIALVALTPETKEPADGSCSSTS